MAPDVEPACSRGAEGIVSQLPDDTADDEPRVGEANPPTPKDGEGDAGGGDVVIVDSMKPDSSQELSVNFTTPPQQRIGGRSPTLQELMHGERSS